LFRFVREKVFRAKEGDVSMIKFLQDARGVLIAGALASLCAVTACSARDGRGGSAAPPSGTVPAQPTIVAASFPNIADGRPVSQLGLYWWRYWSYEQPFLDLSKASGIDWAANGAAGRMGWEDLWANGVINKTTLYPRSIPQGYSFIRGGIFRNGAKVYPDYYAGEYVLEWDGDADLRFGFGLPLCSAARTNDCQTRIGANRVEARYSRSNAEWSTYEITRIGAAGINNIRLYRKQNEQAIKSGRFFDPIWVDYARRYKILRFVQVQEASEARPFRAGDFARKDQATWSPDWIPNYAKAPDAPKQTSFEMIFRASVETGTAAWVHVAGLPGAPPEFNALVGTSQHDLWRRACRTHLNTVLASPDWAVYMDEIVRGLIASGYPADRMLYLEPWNEIWNWSAPWGRMTHCGTGVADVLVGSRAKVQGTYWRYGFGYLAAHAMVEFDKALTRAGRRQAWTLAMGSHHAWLDQTTGSLEGFKRYFATKGVNPSPWLKNVGVTTASYYNGVFDRVGGFITAASEAEHAQKWRNAILSDPTGLMTRRTNWTLNTYYDGGTVPWIVDFRNKQEALAKSYGAYFLGDYEGESHDVLPPHLSADPVIVNWAEQYIESAEGERLTRSWIDALKAQNPNAVISNYGTIHPRDLEGASASDRRFEEPWYDGFYGENTGRTRGLSHMQRP
jgi:hypothetical protein